MNVFLVSSWWISGISEWTWLPARPARLSSCSWRLSACPWGLSACPGCWGLSTGPGGWRLSTGPGCWRLSSSPGCRGLPRSRLPTSPWARWLPTIWIPRRCGWLSACGGTRRLPACPRSWAVPACWLHGLSSRTAYWRCRLSDTSGFILCPADCTEGLLEPVFFSQMFYFSFSFRVVD